jgi:putative ABC transport system permease protein
MIPLRYNLRSLVVRKSTSAATALGVTLVTLVFASALMLAEGVRKTISTGGRDDVAVVVRQGSDAELSSSFDVHASAIVSAAPGLAHEGDRPAMIAESVVVVALPKAGAEGFSNVTLRGTTPDALRLAPNVRILEGRLPAPGTDEAMMGARLRGRFEGLALGETIELRKNRPLHVVGVFSDEGSAAESEIWADREIVGAAFGRPSTVSSIHARLARASDFDAFRDAVEHDKRRGLEAIREPAFLEQQSDGLSTFLRVMGTIVAVFFSLGAALGATITMHAAVANRAREIGTLRALGFSRRSILFGFLVESTVLCAAGGVVGVALSFATSFIHISMVNFATWSELVFTLTPTPAIVASSLVFALVVGLLGGLIPALRAARVSPLAALRS